MIYDTFMYNGEESILKIRLETLNDVVDKFIILESPRSHSQIPRELEYPKQKESFSKFKDKIHYYAIDYCSNENGHYNDFQGREVIANILYKDFNFNENDILIHGDLDEIPNSRILKTIIESDKNIDTPYTFLTDYRVLCFDLQHDHPNGQFPGSMLLKKKHLDRNQLYQLRQIRMNPVINGKDYKNSFNLIANAGWHLTYCAGINRTIDKFRFFCHSTETGDWTKNREGLINCIKTKIGFTPDKPNLKLIEWKKENFPDYIFNNPESFKENLSFNY